MNRLKLKKNIDYEIKNKNIFFEINFNQRNIVFNHEDFKIGSFIVIELKEKIKFKNKKTKFFYFYFYKNNNIFYEYINLKNINISKKEIKNIFLVWY